MKKMIAMLLALAMLLAMTGCGKQDTVEDTTPETTEEITEATTEPTPVITSALEFYTQVWAAFAEEDQFAVSGGDADNATEGPGQYAMTEENAEMFQYLLHVTEELYEMLDDDVVTMQHMMNINTFSSAVAKLKDPAQAESFAEGYKQAVQAQQWMCGFPDLVVVISVGDYVVMAYGHEGNINNLIAACAAVEPSSEVLVNAPAMVE